MISEICSLSFPFGCFGDDLFLKQTGYVSPRLSYNRHSYPPLVTLLLTRLLISRSHNRQVWAFHEVLKYFALIHPEFAHVALRLGTVEIGLFLYCFVRIERLQRMELFVDQADGDTEWVPLLLNFGQGLVLVVFGGHQCQLAPAAVPVVRQAALVLVGYFLLDQKDIGDEMPLVLLQGRCLDILQELEKDHLFPHLVKTLKIKHTLLNTLEYVLPSKHIRYRSLFSDRLNPHIFIHNERTISIHIHHQAVFGRLDLSNFLHDRDIVMMLLNVDIHTPGIYDDHWSLLLLLWSLADWDLLLWLVNYADEFQCDLVLEVYAEMSQKEDGLLNNTHVSLQNKLLLQSGLNVLQELLFLWGFQGYVLELVLLLLDVVLHLVAQLSGQLIMIPQLFYGLLIVLELLVLLLDLIHGNTDNVDHVPEDCSAYQLHHHDQDHLDVILRGQIPVTNRNHGRDGPIQTVDVLNVPLYFIKTKFEDPVRVVPRVYVGDSIQQ